MERDFPKGHPAAVDYKGEKYSGPRAPWQDDFAEGHPARGGANTGELDTPDGQREAALDTQLDLADLQESGPTTPEHREDFERKDTAGLLEQEAREYLTGRNYAKVKIDEIIRDFGVPAVLADKAANTTA
jgi:hypothetical protein